MADDATAPPASVMVAVRVRPQNQRELSQKEANCIELGDDGFCRIIKPEEDGKAYEFSFDYAYGDNTPQSDVYMHLGAPILAKAFAGWNGTIFAYGQTGSGKSFSMTGTPELRGIIPQMNDDLFVQIAQQQAEATEKQFLVTCSFMEIYNEVLYDLLDPNMKKGTSKEKKNSTLDIHEHPTLGVYVAGLQEIAVDSSVKIQALMDQGNEMRAVGVTNMNATSSRSHSIFIIRLLQKEVLAGQQKDTRATINLVDLAGSERQGKTGATGDKLKEGANINKSLSALGNVINALAEQCKNPKKKVFIPYRNSKLTRVLQESLGGNSVTVMLAALSPAAYNFDETLNTLQYAERAKSIQLKARKNTQMTEVGALKAQVEELRRQLEEAASRGGGGGPGGGGDGLSDADKAVLEARYRAQLAEMDLVMKSQFEETARLAREREAERRALLEQQAEEKEALLHEQDQQRKAVLASGTREWVRIILQAARAESAPFAAAVDSLSEAYMRASDKLAEQLNYTGVLKSAMQAEIHSYGAADRAAAASADGEAGFDEAQRKVLLDQILLKLKTFKEESAVALRLRDEMAAVLAQLEAVVAQQAEAVQAGAHAALAAEFETDTLGGYERRLREAALQRSLRDFGLFASHAQEVRAKATNPMEDPVAIDAIRALATSLDGTVGAELKQVDGRLAQLDERIGGAADGGGGEAAQRDAMAKRVGVLAKELKILNEVATRTDLAKTLPAIVHVLQGVVTRAAKRLSARDRAKEKTLAAKEAQVAELRREAAEVRQTLFDENQALKGQLDLATAQLASALAAGAELGRELDVAREALDGAIAAAADGQVDEADAEAAEAERAALRETVVALRAQVDELRAHQQAATAAAAAAAAERAAAEGAEPPPPPVDMAAEERAAWLELEARLRAECEQLRARLDATRDDALAAAREADAPEPSVEVALDAGRSVAAAAAQRAHVSAATDEAVAAAAVAASAAAAAAGGSPAAQRDAALAAAAEALAAETGVGLSAAELASAADATAAAADTDAPPPAASGGGRASEASAKRDDRVARAAAGAAIVAVGATGLDARGRERIAAAAARAVAAAGGSGRASAAAVRAAAVAAALGAVAEATGAASGTYPPDVHARVNAAANVALGLDGTGDAAEQAAAAAAAGGGGGLDGADAAIAAAAAQAAVLARGGPPASADARERVTLAAEDAVLAALGAGADAAGRARAAAKAAVAAAAAEAGGGAADAADEAAVVAAVVAVGEALPASAAAAHAATRRRAAIGGAAVASAAAALAPPSALDSAAKRAALASLCAHAIGAAAASGGDASTQGAEAASAALSALALGGAAALDGGARARLAAAAVVGLSAADAAAAGAGAGARQGAAVAALVAALGAPAGLGGAGLDAASQRRVLAAASRSLGAPREGGGDADALAPAMSPTSVPSIAPIAVKSWTRSARIRDIPDRIRIATSPTSCGTSWQRTASVVATLPRPAPKAAPIARPSVKLCEKSATSLR